MTVRQARKPLSFDDVGLAARMLCRLPDRGDGALAALAWAAANMWRKLHKGETRVKFPLSMVTEHLLERCEAAPLLSKHIMAVPKWRAVAAIASALTRDGDDPSGSAILFHHRSSAPEWALDRDDAHWIGRWAFYPPRGP